MADEDNDDLDESNTEIPDEYITSKFLDRIG
jgi:hypothetical protein